LQRRTRNRICIWLIFIGLLNFLAYAIIYAELGGDARNGWTEYVEQEDGTMQKNYYLKGHFLRDPGGRGEPVEVPEWVWAYSYIHSITIWPTNALCMVCMLILAKPHIIATMSEDSWIRGPTFIGVAITLICVVCSAMTVWFVVGFISDWRA
jgi:hypothetical protein